MAICVKCGSDLPLEPGDGCPRCGEIKKKAEKKLKEK